jgi:putative MATE family efflux protein
VTDSSTVGGAKAVDRRIISLALPALGSLAVEPAYVMVDTAIVGRIGTEQLAGLAIAATVLSFVFVGGNFLTYGATEQIARRLGAGDRAGAAGVGVQAMWLSLMVGVPIAPLLAIAAPALVRLFGADGDVVHHATTYLSISAIGVPFFLVTLAAQGILRGAADYITPLWVLLAANVVNLVLEVVFVYGLDMGVAGSALGTVIAQVGAAIVFVRRIRPRLAPAIDRRPHRAGMAPLLSAGKHLLLRVGSMLAVFGGATAVAGRIDDPTLAAHQIGFSVFTLLALVLDALAVPAQTLVADQLGRGDHRSAALIARRAVWLSVLAGVVLCVVLAAISGVLPHVFTADDAVASRATSALLFLAVLLIPGAIAFAHDGILIGAGDFRFLGRAALGYLVAVIPIAVLTLLAPELGIAGIWAGLLLWMCLRAYVNHQRTRGLLAI